MTGWTVRVEVETTSFDDDQLWRLQDSLGPGSGSHHDMTDRLTIGKHVEASHLKPAATAGLDAILVAVAESGIDGVAATLEVRRYDEPAVNEAIRRTWRDMFVGTSEIAERFGVSRQRVSELARNHADFPEPLARLKSGPIYDKADVDAFERGWQRRRTGRPRKNAS